GFLVRYKPDTTPITGYESEPYHLRYVGTQLSRVGGSAGDRAREQGKRLCHQAGVGDPSDGPPKALRITVR
ncbi:hypothetical protein C5C27_16620, partial [Rathayibacter sp. AY2B7]